MIFFCCFPFVGWNIGTDCQPFALITAAFLLIYKKEIVIRNKSLLIGLSLFIAVLVLFSSFNVRFFDICKRMFSYASILIIPMAIYNGNIDVHGRKFERRIKFFMLIWFFVGLVQMLWKKDFMKFLVPLMRTSENRGVCSLASEPSFYGYMCFFFFLIALDFEKGKWIYSVLQVIQTVLLAQSTIAILYFFVYVLFCALVMLFKASKRNIRNIILILSICLLGVGIILCLYPDKRMGYLVKEMLHNPFRLITTDESVRSRFEAIIYSFSRLGIPYFIGTKVIMSGYGGVFYELGIFSVLLYTYIWKIIACGYENVKKNVIPLTITVCMFSAIQIALPMLAFFLGYCVLREKK